MGKKLEMGTDGVVNKVCEDLQRRHRVGVKKYGTTLDRDDLDLRDWLQHAYEEALDMANYLKAAIERLSKPDVGGAEEESLINRNEKAEFAVKILLEYAKENGVNGRDTTDLSPLEQWLILRLYNAVRQSEQLVCENCGDVAVMNEGDWCDECLEK